MMLVDSHCHLDSGKFNGDRQALIKTAEDAGVSIILNPGVDLDSSKKAIELADAYPLVYAAVGVHPHNAETFDKQVVTELRELTRHPKVVAIGEIGLDFYRNYSPHDDQRRAFDAQLELAAELKLPVIVHDRQATSEVVDRLVAWTLKDSVRCGVVHSYSGGMNWLPAILETGFYIGISGPVTFAKSTTLHQVVKTVPLNRLLIETDAPYLTPEPYRGRRNEPAFVQYVAKEIATLQKLPVIQVVDQTTENFKMLFSLIGPGL
jgi:TatD DNase family protein